VGRPIEKLNALQISRLARKIGVHCDGGGLSLRVSSKQASSWIFRYMLGRRAHEMGIGPYPALSLADARKLAAAARRQKAHGIDPIAAREEVKLKQALERAKAVTFKTCAEAYIAAMRPSWSNAKHAAQWENTLKDYAYPLLGELPVQAVDVGLVHKVLDPLWREKTETASRLRGRIEAILNWASVRGYRLGDMCGWPPARKSFLREAS